MSYLRSVATAVKSSRVSHRQTTLIHGLQSVADKLMGPFSLPLNPAMVAKGISVEVRTRLSLIEHSYVYCLRNYVCMHAFVVTSYQVTNRLFSFR